MDEKELKKIDDEVKKEQSVEQGKIDHPQDEHNFMENTANENKTEEREADSVKEKTSDKEKENDLEKESDWTKEDEEALEKARSAALARQEAEKKTAEKEVAENVNKKTLLKRIGLGIVSAVKKVAYVVMAPARWVGDRVIEITMPKESRAKMYNTAIENAYEEQRKKQEAATKENGHTIAKKMDILNDEKLTDHEKILELSKLCYDTKRTIYVKTQEGAFKFERSGDSVLISHANPMKRTLESQATYTFRAIGGVTFGKLGGIKDKEVDIRDAVEQIRMDKGFDKHTRELEKNIILESDIITDVEKSAIQKDVVNKEEVDKNILEGNQKDVKEAVLDAIVAHSIVVGAGTEYEKEYEIQHIEPKNREPYNAINVDGAIIDLRDVDRFDYLLKNYEPEQIKYAIDSIKGFNVADKESIMENTEFGHYTFSHDSDVKVREAVVRQAISGRAPEVLDELAHDPEPSVRYAVVDTKRLANVQELLNDDCDQVRWHAEEIKKQMMVEVQQTSPINPISQPEALRAPENDQEFIDSMTTFSPEVPPVMESQILDDIVPVPEDLTLSDFVPETEDVSQEVPPVSEDFVQENKKEEFPEESIDVEPMENIEADSVEVPKNEPSKVYTRGGMIEQVEETETVWRDVEPPVKSPLTQKLEELTGAARSEETTRKETIVKEEVR